MLADAMIDRVCQLLAEGKLSQRKIARLLGISRGTVGSLAKGKRPHVRKTAWMDEELFDPQGPPARCHGCGGMVYHPCHLCRIRRLDEINRLTAIVRPPDRRPC